MQREPARLAGIERWQAWFADHLSDRLTVEELGWRGAFVGGVWKIRFPDSGERKVYVAPEALALDGEDFQAAVSSLDPVELVNRLRKHPHRVVRIWSDGKIEDLN